MWNSKKKRNASSGSGLSSSLSGINEAAAEKMFVEIADPDDPSTATMEGIFTLGEKLDMDATEDIRILVLLWKMNIRDKPSQMSKQEWLQGCSTLQADSWDKFRNLIPSLDTGFLDQSDFKDFYKFCFTFSRQGTHKSLDKELTLALLKLVLGAGDRVPKERLESFTTFLEQDSSQYTHINLDQWTSFLDFCLEVQDLSTYDESTSAWPVMIDEYVEYMEEQQKAKK
eukprot:CAMPEP_0172446904 /NCGR_PEP_ID=MMETSP1065-20121228/6354_1 /TAXON_ID=265537 /ORGANISM="Amphiprora paludosa, Strain CCMP125" /LENGTH=226 /DNA_ID=CAMNT_0013198093 /DNA_START=191 /DNA_END=871 /DNA_ORIENTATION=+